MIPNISIIVPIYNAEKHLNRSIKSILKQTFNNLEVILVNDGSTDKSLEICKQFQKKDKRVKVIDKPNGGVSSARNAGIEMAKGEYIGFIDPDDWIEIDMYENLYKQIKSTDSDICFCNFFTEKNGVSTPSFLNTSKDLLKGQEIVHEIMASMVGNLSLNNSSQKIMASVWRLILKRELIDKYSVRFNSEIPLMEDLLFCIQVLLICKKVSIDRGTYYHYVNNSNSAATTYRVNMFELQKKVFSELEQIILKENLHSTFEQRLNVRYVNMYISIILNEVHKENSKNVIERIKFIKSLCKDHRLKNVLNNELNKSNITLRKRLILLALKYELGLFLYLYYSTSVKLLNNKYTVRIKKMLRGKKF